MARLKSKAVRGRLIEIEESSGFLGGITYILYDDGRIISQSSDLNFILREYDNIW